jgi:hypothetical protein
MGRKSNLKSSVTSGGRSIRATDVSRQSVVSGKGVYRRTGDGLEKFAVCTGIMRGELIECRMLRHDSLRTVEIGRLRNDRVDGMAVFVMVGE